MEQPEIISVVGESGSVIHTLSVPDAEDTVGEVLVMICTGMEDIFPNISPCTMFLRTHPEGIRLKEDSIWPRAITRVQLCSNKDNKPKENNKLKENNKMIIKEAVPKDSIAIIYGTTRILVPIESKNMDYMILLTIVCSLLDLEPEKYRLCKNPIQVATIFNSFKGGQTLFLQSLVEPPSIDVLLSNMKAG